MRARPLRQLVPIRRRTAVSFRRGGAISGEGVGKSTQLARLAEALRARGKTVVTTRKPGGTPGAKAIRGLLVAGRIDRWSARLEAQLFAAARADCVERVIRPSLARGDGGTNDRFGAKRADYHMRLSAAFGPLAASEPHGSRLIEADGPADRVTDRVLAENADLL